MGKTQSKLGGGVLDSGSLINVMVRVRALGAVSVGRGTVSYITVVTAEVQGVTKLKFKSYSIQKRGTQNIRRLSSCVAVAEWSKVPTSFFCVHSRESLGIENVYGAHPQATLIVDGGFRYGSQYPYLQCSSACVDTIPTLRGKAK